MHEMIMGIYVSYTAGSTAVPIPVPYHFMKPHYALHPSLSLLPMPTSSGGAASIRTLLTKVKEGRVCTPSFPSLVAAFLFLSDKAPTRNRCAYRTPEKNQYWGWHSQSKNFPWEASSWEQIPNTFCDQTV